MALLKDIDDWMFGTHPRYRERLQESHQKKMAQMDELLKTQQGRTLILKAQKTALESGRTMYGSYGRGATTDPFEKAGKLALAEQRLRESGAEKAADATLDKINQLAGVQEQIEKKEKTTATEAALSEYFQSGLKELEDKEFGRASQKAVDKFEEGFAREAKKRGVEASAAELLFGELYKEERGKAGIFRDDVLPRRDVIDARDYFSEGETPAFDDLTQGATADFPEENIPRTFEQLGMTETRDQQTFQEMQKALPDRDLRQEYENDPESFQRLMKLWREKKLNKKNLHKAFSAIQQKARESLGVA